MENISESSYWGMVWKTNAKKKEIAALHEFILELIEDDCLDDEWIDKYKVVCNIQETLEHERMKKQLAKLQKCK